MKQAITLMALVAMMGTTVAIANEPVKNEAPKVDKRIERQKKRISAKLDKGKINEQEAANLNKKVDEVAAQEAEMKKDGKLTKEERKELHKKLNVNNQAIKKTTEEAKSAQ